ncbi:MAG TPA: hypothetical protein VFS39_17370, partial [Nitrospira sp.]|nr:hypothetical protein [Nitrospira sp.]
VGHRQLSLRGTLPVQPGMELTLLILVPASEEPVGIAESRVTSATGTDFEVQLLTTALISMAELEQQVQENASGHRFV